MALLRRAPLWLLLVGGCHLVFDGEVGTVSCQEEGRYGPPACPDDQTCVGGTCTRVGAPLGAPCSDDGDCRHPHHCLDPASVGLEGAARCTTPCCTSSDCGPPAEAQICFAPPGGSGTLCWPAAELDRAAPGLLDAGEECGSGDACRSGRCNGSCDDVCCVDNSCDRDETCRVKELAGELSWGCGMSPSGSDERYCLSHLDCRSGRCEAVEGLPEPLCLEPCCASRECGSLEIEGVHKLLACAIGPAGLRACSRLLPATADGAVGDPCDEDGQCRSGLCLPDGEGRYCSDLCCDDESCGNVTRYACRAGPLGDVWALRCVRR